MPDVGARLRQDKLGQADFEKSRETCGKKPNPAVCTKNACAEICALDKHVVELQGEPPLPDLFRSIGTSD